MDKAGREYWNSAWKGSAVPGAVDPADLGPRNWVNRRFHRAFLELFDKSRASSTKLLEVGCAQSRWLPYFAKEFGFSITGLDYSPIGCEMARTILVRCGVVGEVVCADFFAPPDSMRGAFDVVVSFGVAEHFDDTAACIRAFASFLKPGGTLFTNIPNMCGLVGFLQRMFNRPVYDIHQPLDREELGKAHESAGLDVISCDYFIFNNFGVCSLNGLRPNGASWIIKRSLIGALGRISMLAGFIEDRTCDLRPGRFASAHVNCVARKPA